MCGQCEVWSHRCITPMVEDLQSRKYFGLHLSALHYWPISTKRTPFVAHARSGRGMKSQLNHSNGRRDTVEKYFGVQVKCPSILTDFNGTYTVCNTCADSARYEFSVTPFQWKNEKITITGFQWRSSLVHVTQHHYEHILKTTGLEQWYSTFSVRVPPDIIFLQLCTAKVGA
jgi:hypothetical protein